MAALAAALALPASALGVRVHVRVEGKTTTIFGARQPLLTPFTGSLPIGEDSIELAQPTPLGALEAASAAGEFFYALQQFSFGPFVSQVGRYPGEGTAGWVFKVNGASPPVGADAVVLEEGDEVLWYYAQFGIVPGGPPTLDLVRLPRGCFRADALDDAGVRTAASNVVFRLDGRRVESASGRICPRGAWSEIRATKDGAVRSEVLRRR
jgi:hypothetical protein